MTVVLEKLSQSAVENVIYTLCLYESTGAQRLKQLRSKDCSQGRVKASFLSPQQLAGGPHLLDKKTKKKTYRYQLAVGNPPSA